MTTYETHTTETAPEASRPILAGAAKKFGFLPNLLGVFAESPAALKAYLAVSEIFETDTSFSPTERQLILITASRENECRYCVAAHSTIAGAQGVSDEVVAALRDGSPLAEPQLESLRSFTRKVVDQRGHLSDEDIEAFLDAGYTKAQVFEVILGVGQKTLSNYTNHVADTTLDEAFAGNDPAPATCESGACRVSA